MRRFAVLTILCLCAFAPACRANGDVETLSVMVPRDSRAHRLRDLGGMVVCVMIASPAQQALEARLGGLRVPIIRLAFEEEAEMLDAYNVGRCQAVAEDAATLAAMRRANGVNHLASRVLAEPLGTVAVGAR